MSDITRSHVATPSTPSASTSVDFVNTDRRPCSLDDKGVLNVLSNGGMANYLRNSGFWFAQRQVPATLTTYSNVGGRIISGADGWGTSNENASIQYRRVDTSGAKETGLQSRFWGEYTKITATGKMAALQVIEGSEAMSLRGRTVRLQVWAKAIVGTPIALKIGVMSWSGTLDTVPSGAGLMWSAWGANGVDPTLAASFAWCAPKSGVTPDNATASTNAALASATTTWQRFGVVVDVPDTCKNLIVVVWSDNQVIATNGFALAQASLTDGYEIQDWTPSDYVAELHRVRRYYSKSFAVDTAPVTNVGINAGERRAVAGKAGAVANSGYIPILFPVEMRAAPTVTVYNPAAANALARNITGTADMGATSIVGTNAASTYTNSTGVAATAVGDLVAIHYSADAEL